ncbi:MAG: LysR family transcriptional regulator [Deltaproteobacteria bacterium]|nr:LysR family transcriptional regulator [Deltaproteobacteria bacterium]
MLEHLRALAVFARVAELGSFRAAARALALSPSVVSHHVSELERRLALPLIHRSTRRLALTPDGERLLIAAREMVDAATRGIDAVSGRSATPTGALRLTVPAFLAETALTRDLAAFATAHPGVTLTVSFTDQPRDLLRDGLDLALRIGKREDSSHKTRSLGEMRRALVGAPRYLAGRTVRAPHDLAACDHIVLSTRPAELVLTSAGARPVTIPLTPRVSVDSAAAMRELALASTGLATVPEVLVRAELARGRLVEVLPDWRPAAMPVYAIWPGNAQRAALTLRLMEFMAPRVVALFADTAPEPRPRRR